MLTVGAGDLDRGALLQASGQKDGAEAVAEQAVDREVGAGALAEPQLDAQGKDLVDLALDGLAGQTRRGRGRRSGRPARRRSQPPSRGG